MSRDLVRPPWAGVGGDVPDTQSQDVRGAMESVNLDWQVGMVDLVTLPEAQREVDSAYGTGYGTPKPIVESDVSECAVVRQDTGGILGIVGPRWHPLQNEEMFNWFQPFLDEDICSINSAGSFYDGKKVWVLAEINDDPVEIVPGDAILKYMLMSNGHDGKTSVRIGFTNIRIWCSNTLRMAHNSKASRLVKIRHTSQVNITLQAMQDVVDAANRDFATTAEQYQFLARRGVNAADLRKYVKVVLGVEKVEDADLKTRTLNKIDQIVGLVESGRGNTLAKVRGTWWAAYNGVTEYFNHHAGRNANNRLNSLWLGTGEAANELALETAIDMAG